MLRPYFIAEGIMNKKSIQDSKQKILQNIIYSAKEYKKNLIGRTFLLLFEGNSIEVMFKKDNFLHLCGVDTSLYAGDFYAKAVKGSLKSKEIHFSSIHPYRFSAVKTQNLSKI